MRLGAPEGGATLTATISVIVPARDAASTLPRTLESLARQDVDRPYEVIVVDAGSRDSTPDIAAAADEHVRVVRVGPCGPGLARNRGVELAHGQALAFTDADCFPRSGWLAAGVRALEEAELVQGRVVPDRRAAPGPYARTIAVESERGLYETANLFVRRDAFERAGGFEEWLHPTIGVRHMAEDILLGWSVRRSGAPTAFCPEAEVEHAVFPRGARGFIAERRRLRYFADIARAVPELRRELFFARAFLSPRSAVFDLALVGGAVAAWRRSPVPLLAALPYARELRRIARPWGRRRLLEVAAANILADAVGAYSLALGSLRRRTPVL